MHAKYKTIFIAAFCITLSFLAAAQTVIVVRHGEKRDATADTALSPAGEVRAEHLANMLAASNLRAIYTTQYKRTMLLVAPTAKRLSLTPVIVQAKEVDALLAKLRLHSKDEAVLAVGHSNTIPAILKGLGHTTVVTVTEEEFDNLFIVTMQPSGAPTVVRLKY